MEKKDNKEVVKQDGAGTPESVAEEQKKYDETWRELEQGTDVSTGGEIPANNTDKDLPLPNNAGASENGDVSTVVTKDDEPKSDKYGTVKSMEKALDDTKAYAHRLEADKAELKKRIDELQNGKATPAEVEEAKKAVQIAQDDLDVIKNKVYADYPELQQLIDPILERNKELETKVVSLETAKVKDKEAEQKETLIKNFNDNVKPKVLEVHSDFDSIMQSEEYWNWAEKQRPALKTAAFDSPDPVDIIWAVSEFKKDLAKKEVPEIKNKEKSDHQQRLKNSQTLRGSSTQFLGATKKDDNPDNYDWDGAGETLKKQGIGSG